MLKQMIWPLNHTSHTKLNFNGFVANVQLRDNIGIIIFDLWGHGGCWRPKMAWRSWFIEKSIYLTKVSQQPQKPHSGSNQIWATTSYKKHTATSEVTVASEFHRFYNSKNRHLEFEKQAHRAWFLGCINFKTFV